MKFTVKGRDVGPFHIRAKDGLVSNENKGVSFLVLSSQLLL